MTLGIASDHRGYKLKEQLKIELKKASYEVIDFGTDSDLSVDYTDYAFPLSEAVRDKKVTYGISICGAGIGMSIACNKVKGVRCARVVNKEDAIATRCDNDANVLALNEKISLEDALDIIYTFINTPFSSDERHHRRVNKIISYEENN